MIELKMLGIVCLLIVLIVQGTWVFRNAMKNKIPNPWIWGLIGLMNIPTSLIIYLIYKKFYLKRNKDK